MKMCVCGSPMTFHEWKNEWVCHECGRTRREKPDCTFTVLECRKCGHRLYVDERFDFPEKLTNIAGRACDNCGEQEEGLWALLGRSDSFQGEILVEWGGENE